MKFFILEVSLSLTWCRRNSPNYEENEGFLDNFFRLWKMLKLCTLSFLRFIGIAHVTPKLYKLLFWKFNWVWRDFGGRHKIIKKVADIRKIVLCSRQCQKCVDSTSWISLALLTWLRNYINFYCGSLFEFDVISVEDSKLSRKWQIYGTLF